ncbi:hypothetical protein COBT_004273, partial [Conglomerata obtusa]
FTSTNNMFELSRRQFYRNLNEDKKYEIIAQDENIVRFWNQMWEKTLQSSNNHKFEEYVYESIDTYENISKFPSFNEFANNSKILPNWKSA